MYTGEIGHLSDDTCRCPTCAKFLIMQIERESREWVEKRVKPSLFEEGGEFHDADGDGPFTIYRKWYDRGDSRWCYALTYMGGTWIEGAHKELVELTDSNKRPRVLTPNKSKEKRK